MAHVTECPDHDACLVIESDGWPDVAGSWRSHFADDLPPEARLNPDDPEQASIEDRRKGKAEGATLARRAPTQAESDRAAGFTTADGEWVGPVAPDGTPVRDGNVVRR